MIPVLVSKQWEAMEASTGMMYGGASASCGAPGGGDDPWDHTKYDHDTLPMELDWEENRPAQILIFGHSYVRRLQDFLSWEFGYYHNLGLSYDVAHVQWMHRGGLTADFALWNYVQPIVETQPDIVIIQLGGNDVSFPFVSPENAGSALYDLGASLIHLGVRYVIVCQELPRSGLGIPRYVPEYNAKVSAMNSYVRRILGLGFIPGLRYWQHRSLWRSTRPTAHRDGVHLNDLGHHRLYRSMRGAVLHALGQIRQHLRRQ